MQASPAQTNKELWLRVKPLVREIEGETDEVEYWTVECPIRFLVFCSMCSNSIQRVSGATLDGNIFWFRIDAKASNGLISQSFGIMPISVCLNFPFERSKLGRRRLPVSSACMLACLMSRFLAISRSSPSSYVSTLSKAAAMAHCSDSDGIGMNSCRNVVVGWAIAGTPVWLFPPNNFFEPYSEWKYRTTQCVSAIESLNQILNWLWEIMYCLNLESLGIYEIWPRVPRWVITISPLCITAFLRLFAFAGVTYSQIP